MPTTIFYFSYTIYPALKYYFSFFFYYINIVNS